MTENTTSLRNLKVLSGSALKSIACLSMLADHLAKFYLYRFPWTNAVWFSFFGRSISFLQILLMFGRFAFPLFVFLLVVGFEHTRNKKIYGFSLFILALLSEIPFNLMSGHDLFRPTHNVMFTLLIGFLAMCSLEYFKQKSVLNLLLLVALYFVSRYMQADYQTSGFIFILLMYGLRKERIIRCVAASTILQMKAMVFLSLLLTFFYNGERGFIKTPFIKYCFYAFYPVHMLIIYFLSLT